MRAKLFALLGVLVLLPSFLIAATITPAGATTFDSDTPFTCQASSPIGPQTESNDIVLHTTAPSTVTQGQNFTISAASDPSTGFPSDLGSGATANDYKNFFVKIPDPTN